MSYMLSDEESTDSDSGVRFKTESTRKLVNDSSFRRNRREDLSYETKKSYLSRQRDRSRDRQYTSRERYRKSRSKSTDRYRQKRSRSRSVEHKYTDHRSRSKEDRLPNKPRDSRSYDKSSKFDREHSKHHRDKSFAKSRLSEEISDMHNRKICQDSISENERKKSISSEENYRPVLPKMAKIDSQNTKVGLSLTSNKEDYSPMVYSKCSKSSQKKNDKSPKKETNIDSKLFDPASLSGNSSKNVDAMSDSSSSEVYGPTIPKKSTNNENISAVIRRNFEKNVDSNSQDEQANIYGPVLPTKSEKSHSVYGSVLPILNSEKSVSEHSSSSDNNDSNIYGPALPGKISDSKVYGPCIPSNLVTESSIGSFGPNLPPNFKQSDNQSRVLGPTLPPHLKSEILNFSEQKLKQAVQVAESDEDDDLIGPLPEGHSSKNISHKLLEERALEMRINALNPVDTTPRREEWMTELPDVHRVNLG